MSAPLSDDDKAFIRAILNAPGELTRWLVYADWLDERDDPRGRFIRLEVRSLDPGITPAERIGVVAELEDLRPTLDPDWVAVFDRPRIENCDEHFAFKCPRQWEQLKGTADPAVRHCEACGKSVHYCRDLSEAAGLAVRGECVAVASGVSRRPGDLDVWQRAAVGMTMGIMWVPEPPPPARRPWWKFW